MNGQLQKNGGNVASFFCTPDLRVVHAVGNNVSSDRLLTEARWALDAWHGIRDSKHADLAAQASAAQAAHLAALNASASHFTSLVREEWTQAQDSFASRWERRRDAMRGGSYRPRHDDNDTVDTLARLRAAGRLSGDRAHKILAAQPLAKLNEVGPRLFEKLANERFNDDRSQIYRAADGLKAAKDKGLPMLLVFYRGHGKNKDELDDATERFYSQVLADARLAPAVREYVVVATPIRQMAALSQLADLPLYEVPSQSSPVLIVARPDGRQVSASSGEVDALSMASRLWPSLNESRLERAAQMADEDSTAALKLLRLILASPADRTTRQQAQEQINAINFSLADQYAERGRTTSALRLLRKIEDQSTGQQLQHAKTRIAELRADL